MTSVQGHPKRELQSHVLGVLSVDAMCSAANVTQHRFTYKVLPTVVGKAVFMGVYAVSNFVMKKLQVLAESNCLHASEGVRKAWSSVHPGIVTYCEKEIEQYINLGPGQSCPWVYEAE